MANMYIKLFCRQFAMQNCIQKRLPDLATFEGTPWVGHFAACARRRLGPYFPAQLAWENCWPFKVRQHTLISHRHAQPALEQCSGGSLRHFIC